MKIMELNKLFFPIFAKKDMMNSGKTNVVGHMRKEEEFLIDVIKPWQKFEFTKM